MNDAEDRNFNLMTAGAAHVEVGTESYPVTGQDVAGDDRDRICAEQTRRYPGIAGYAGKTRGTGRPLVALRRV